VVEDPLTTLEVLAPYVVTTHLRDSVLFEHPRGAAGQWVVLGDGQIDFVRFVGQFRKWCPRASMQLEVITGRPPRVIPYLGAGFLEGISQGAGLGSLRALSRSPRRAIPTWERW